MAEPIKSSVGLAAIAKAAGIKKVYWIDDQFCTVGRQMVEAIRAKMYGLKEVDILGGLAVCHTRMAFDYDFSKQADLRDTSSPDIETGRLQIEAQPAVEIPAAKPGSESSSSVKPADSVTPNSKA